MAEETATIKAGDVVQLKSGGPIMTVSHVSGKAYCQYFKRDEEIIEKAFPLTSLKKIESFSEDSSPNPEAGGAI